MNLEPEILWTPSESLSKSAHLTRYMEWLKKEYHLSFADYNALWQWSVDEIEAFWPSLLQFFDVQWSGSYEKVVSGQNMPGVRWFEGMHLSFAEHVFRNETSEYPALIFQSEQHPYREISWNELRSNVAKIASYLKQKGVNPGDRIAAYVPNCPESLELFLACNSVGAVWTSSSPDFGVQSVIDRFQQTHPKIFIGLDGYHYGGKTFERTDESQTIRDALDSVKEYIILDFIPLPRKRNNGTYLSEILAGEEAELTFTRAEFNDPIWILYSSGTTGLPKPITHSVGGILLEHLKYLAFHNNIQRGDRCFWYTTTGWMMWNYIQSSLLMGGTVVMYDGSPAWPDLNVLWQLAEKAKINHFGTSAGFITSCMKAGLEPGKKQDLSGLVSLGSTGSPLPPEGFSWLYEKVKKDLWVASISGGTDVCSAFVGGNPLLQVRKGEIQSRALGCALEAWDPDGKPLINEVGEMVITRPMPSMPVKFWNDIDYARYRESYFEMYPGVWRHGDWTMVSPWGGITIYGRSDSTLNRGGVRIGTSEIYRTVEGLGPILDSLVVCLEDSKGEFYMPLFVVLKDGEELTAELQKEIKSAIRSKCSPRHVPDDIFVCPAIPYTISGKKVELPVKKILTGKTDHKTVNRDALKNPGSLDFFADFINNPSFKWQKD